MKRTLLFLSLLCGCAEPQPSEERVVEIFSWWTNPGEKEALDALISAHQQRCPSAKVINAAAQDSNSARTQLRMRMEAGEPPDAFQANVGQDLWKWVLYNGVDDSETKVEPLDDTIFVGAQARELFPEPVIRAAGHGGRIYGVPVNIHRINALFFNKRVFQKHGLSPPATLEELWQVCEELKQAGVTALAVGGKDTWALSILVFENLLVAREGADFYENYFTGAVTDPADPRILRTLDAALDLWRYTSDDARSVTWRDAVERVQRGDAAMTVMGDWAKGALEQLGGLPDETFGEVPFPGTQGTFVFTADTFALPRGAAGRNGALDLLTTFASLAGQDAFNPIKGSIPARVDADPAAFDPLGKKSIEDFHSDRLSLGMSGLAPSAFSMPVNEALGRAMDQKDAEPARLALAGYYDILVKAKR